jgi:flagellar hook assembly protein FlgD
VSFLRPNYPNPFNPRTRIDFMVPEAGKVEIAVFDILGRRVTTLIESELTAGPHSVEWSGTDHSGNRVASGIYFYRMTTVRTTETRKMVLLK